MSEIKMPTSEELAEVVYKFCKTNDIGYIREDELVCRITDEYVNNGIQKLKENYNLDENEWEEDQESSDAILNQMVDTALFSYKLAKRFYEILNILEKECKVYREIKEGEKFEYLTFFLTEEDIKNIKLVQSTLEIVAKKVYNYCKTNNIKYISKEDFGIITHMGDEKNFNDRILKILIENYMAKPIVIEEEQCIMFFLEDDDITLNKNMSLMIESVSESIYDYCIQNDIKYIEKEELMNKVNMDKSGFDDAINILKDRHFIDEEKKDEDGKTYITIY